MAHCALRCELSSPAACLCLLITDNSAVVATMYSRRRSARSARLVVVLVRETVFRRLFVSVRCFVEEAVDWRGVATLDKKEVKNNGSKERFG